jgi:hypothetical protein
LGWIFQLGGLLVLVHLWLLWQCSLPSLLLLLLLPFQMMLILKLHS